MSTKQRIFIPTYISSVDYQPARVQPRLLFYNGLKDCEPYFVASGSITLATNQALNAFPYFDNYSGQNTTTESLSLLFFNEEAPYGVAPTASLYTEYWEDYVELLYNPRTRLINAAAIIPLADYFKMELNDIVDFRGNYYHLRAINDYSLSDGTCKIQLLGPILPDALNLIKEDNCAFSYSISAINCDFEFTSSIVTTTTTTIAPTPASVQSFFTASGITDSTTISAVTNLANGMVAAGIWDKMYAVYPFVGGTANSNRWNLKDTTIYNITANGSWNYSSNGVFSDRSNNSYLNTGFIPSPSSQLNNLSIGIFSRTSGGNGYDMGTSTFGNDGQVALIANYLSTNNFYYGITIDGANPIGPSNGGLGFFQASRISNNNLVGFINGNQSGNTITTPPNERQYSNSFYIGAINVTNPFPINREPSDRQYAFAYIGQGLTQSELVNYNNLVQQFQTALGRNVTQPPIPTTTTSTTTVLPFECRTGVEIFTILNETISWQNCDGTFSNIQTIGNTNTLLPGCIRPETITASTFGFNIVNNGTLC
jgi:hypothetical protein